MTDTILLLEEKPLLNKVKTIFAIICILAITFAVPVTITQIYKNTNIRSSAVSNQQKTINSYLISSTGSTTQAQSTTNSYFEEFYQFWWVIPLAIILLTSWILLIIAFIKESVSHHLA